MMDLVDLPSARSLSIFETMAKKNILDRVLVPGLASTDHGRFNQLLFWVCGFLLAAFFLVMAFDLLDFLKDPSQHAIGQGVHSMEERWREQYLNQTLLFLFGTAGLFSLIVHAARNPQRRWTKYALRIISIGVIGCIAMGYIAWMHGGFDH